MGSNPPPPRGLGGPDGDRFNGESIRNLMGVPAPAIWQLVEEMIYSFHKLVGRRADRVKIWIRRELPFWREKWLCCRVNKSDLHLHLQPIPHMSLILPWLVVVIRLAPLLQDGRRRACVAAKTNKSHFF